MKKILFGCIAFTALLISCTKYRNVPNKETFVPPPAGVIQYGSLRINEFMCNGSNPVSQSYLGNSTAKWVELYNPTTADIFLDSGKWFLTDTLGIKTKFAVPKNDSGAQWKVPAKGFLVFMCPKTGSTSAVAHRINTSFSLSHTVGAIGIYYQASSASSVIAIDSIQYTSTSFPGGAGGASGQSYGRKPDGQGSPFQPLTTPSPEASNN